MEKSEPKKGIFITFEGIEGSGKSTQIERAAAWLVEKGFDLVRTREPGGSPIADQIRAIVLDSRNAGLSPEADLLLIEAARAQHVTDTILPAIREGRIVLCDRFSDATEAYQGHARDLGVEWVRELNDRFSLGTRPDLPVLFDLRVEAGLGRALARVEALGDDAPKEDRFEQEARDFHEKVREGYLLIARREPERVKVVDALGTPDEVFSRMIPILAEKVGAPLD